MATDTKKKIIDNATLIDSSFLQPIFGGDTKADPNSPEFNGHLHDGRNDSWGHAPKIDLTNHTTGRLTLQDNYVVAKSVSSYPSIIATPNNVLSGTFLNINNSQTHSFANLNGATPLQRLDGYFNAYLPNLFASTGINTEAYPITTPGIVSSAIWYFSLPLDMDVTKPSYFSFDWMGDILTTDGFGNTIMDASKLSSTGQIQAQTTVFRVTWQWYSAGYAVFPPAVIYDGYTPTNLSGTNINQNTLTRGRISNLTVNDLPFKLIVNDSSANNPNYVGLTGLSQATNAVMVGVQVDVLSTGFVNNTLGFQSGHLRFFQGNFTYLSKILGSPVTSFKTF